MKTVSGDRFVNQPAAVLNRPSIFPPMQYANVPVVDARYWAGISLASFSGGKLLRWQASPVASFSGGKLLRWQHGRFRFALPVWGSLSLDNPATPPLNEIIPGPHFEHGELADSALVAPLGKTARGVHLRLARVVVVDLRGEKIPVRASPPSASA
jgi:hypothetical protein